MTLGSVFLIALLQVGSQAPRYETLKNGLRVIVVEDHALPLVSVQLWYSVGSACDPPDRPGLCSVSRMVLDRRDAAALRLGGAGLAVGGETHPDACSFTTILPPNFLEYVLDVESRCLRHSGVTGEDLSRALAAAAVVSERSTAGVESTAIRYVQREMFHGGPYEHAAGFVAESLVDVSAAEVDGFVRTWFTPRNATLIVIGDVSTPVVLDLVRTKFGDIPGGPAPLPLPRQSPPEERTTFTAADLEDRTVAVAFLTPSLGMYENAAIDVLVQRLLGERNDGYRTELREIAGSLSVSTWCATERWRNAGLLMCFASFGEPRDTAGGDRRAPDWRATAEQTRELIVRELSRAAAENPSPAEHNLLRSQAMLAERPRWMRFGSRAQLMGEYETVAGDLLLADFALPRLRSVAVPDVRAAATMLLDSRCVVVYPTMGGDSTGVAGRELPSSLKRAAPYYHPEDVSLETLARLTEAAPQAATPPRRPSVAEAIISPFVCLRVCRFPSPHWTSVATRLTNAPESEPLSWDSCYDSPSDDVRRFREYAAYHAFDAVRGTSRDDDRVSAGWWTSGAQVAVPAMLEWHSKLLRSQSDADLTKYPFVTIAAVGAVDTDELTELTKENWSGWNPSVSALQRLPGGDAEAAAGDSERTESGPAVTIDWTECDIGQEGIMFSADFESTLDGLPGDLDVRVLLLLCGAASDSSMARAGGLAARPPPDPDCEAAVLGVAERLKRARNGDIEPQVLNAAARIVRVQALLRLDSTSAVMTTVLRGETDPWALNDSLELGELRKRVVQVARALRLDVRILVSDGPSSEVRDHLRRRVNAILGAAAP